MAAEFTESFDAILKDTLVDLPGAMRTVALRELRQACREFFERSGAWTKTLTSVDAPADETAIALDTGDVESEVATVLYVAYNGKVLIKMPERPVADSTSDSPYGWFVSSDTNEITLYPYLQNAQTGVLTVRVTLTPAADTDALPRQVTSKWFDAIVAGFLARMYAHPNKPYSAPGAVGMYRQIFIREIGRFAADRKTGHNNSQNWAYPQDW